MASSTTTRPTLADYMRHAELFGTDCVYDTAKTHLHPAELVQLSAELARIDRDTKRRGSRIKPHRLSKTEKVDAVRRMHAEGIPYSRIATHLGIGERWARRLAQAGSDASEEGLDAQDNPRP